MLIQEILFLLLGFVLVLPGGWLAMLGIKALVSCARSLRWSHTTGTVERAQLAQQSRRPRMDDDPTQTSYCMPRVTYRYMVEGKPYVNSLIAFGMIENTNLRAAERRLLGREAGATVTVYFDPADPSKSVLERTPASDSMQVMGAGLFFFISGCGVWCAVFTGVVSAAVQKG